MPEQDTQWSGILEDLRLKDAAYRRLCEDCADASQQLRDHITTVCGGMGLELLERYADASAAQSVYELNAVYTQAFRKG